MRQDRSVLSGLKLIAAVACIIILILPGIVLAETAGTTITGPLVTTTIESNVTGGSITPFPPVLLVYENVTSAANPPPLFILDIPVIENLNCTIYGIVEPGSGNVTITDVQWDWGDRHTPQFHGFPNSHMYNSPGTYILSITTRQSDRQTVTGTTHISVGQSLVTTTPPLLLNISVPGAGGPGLLASAPVLTLLEPVIDRMNVTLNGNLNTESSGRTIRSLSVDWNDGNVTKSDDFPLTHQYAAPGIFTIAISAYQSDGQSTTRNIILDLNEKMPGLPGPATSGSPPNDLPLYLIIIATVIITVVTVVIILQVTRQKGGSLPAPDITTALSARTAPLPDNLPLPEDLEKICSGTDVSPDVLDSVIKVALEIAREGREGQAIGTAFIVGDSKNVMNYSRQFVLNPFHGYHETDRQIKDAGIRGNIKEFAQLDGAFLITGTGVVEAAGRCITVDMSKVNIPGGLGSRHSSVAGITQVTQSVGVVVSQSGGVISVFRDGKIVYTIHSWNGWGKHEINGMRKTGNSLK